MLRLALLNLFRRSGATYITVAVSALVVAATVVTWSLFSLVSQGLTLSEQRLGADVVVYPQDAQVDAARLLFTGVQQMVYLDEDQVLSTLPTDKVEHATSQFFIETKPDEGCCSSDEPLRIVGVDSATDFVVGPWLGGSQVRLEGNNAVAGSSLAAMRSGKTFILGSVMDVVGMLDPTGTGMDHSVFIDIDLARQKATERFEPDLLAGRDPTTLATCVLIKLKEGVDADEFVEQLESGGLPAHAVSVPQVRRQLQENSYALLSLLAVFAVLTAAVGLIALFAHFYHGVRSRTAEIGYLRALGTSRASVVGQFAAEAGLAGLMGGVVGVACGLFVLHLFLARIQEAIVMPQGVQDAAFWAVHAGGGVALAVAVCVLAALVWARRALSVEPAEALTTGGW